MSAILYFKRYIEIMYKQNAYISLTFILSSSLQMIDILGRNVVPNPYKLHLNKHTLLMSIINFPKVLVFFWKLKIRNKQHHEVCRSKISRMNLHISDVVTSSILDLQTSNNVMAATYFYQNGHALPHLGHFFQNTYYSMIHIAEICQTRKRNRSWNIRQV